MQGEDLMDIVMHALIAAIMIGLGFAFFFYAMDRWT